MPTQVFALKAGDKAPEFTTPSSQGEISLADYRGKKHVVLALYFAVFTSVWASELANFQRELEAYRELDAEIIGVSDDDMETLKEFISENGIEFPLVSDSDKEFRKNYGRGRLTYLIDKDGIIQFIQKGVPSNADFLKQLKMLQ